MSSFVLIGAIFLGGNFAQDIHKDFRTAKACVAELKQLGMRDRGDGYWEGGRGNLFVRASCFGPDLKPVRTFK